MAPHIPLSDDLLLRTLFVCLLAAGLVGGVAFRLLGGRLRDYFWGLGAGLLAARLGHYLIYLGRYLGIGTLEQPWWALSASFWPGVAVGLAVLYLRSRRRGESEPWSAAAVGAGILPWGMIVIWLGALLDGAGWGTYSNLPWALSAGQYSPLALLTALGPQVLFDPHQILAFTVHPVQAYFALACLLVGLADVLWLRRSDPRRRTALLVGLLALVWLLLGFLRGDDPPLLLGLTPPQLQAVAALGWSVLVLVTRRRAEPAVAVR